MSGAAIPIFTPLAGFSNITHPELELEQETIKEANWYFKNKVTKSGDVSNIILKKGASFSNADFYRWIKAAQTGNTAIEGLGSSQIGLQVGGPSPRRTLVLVQFFPQSPIPFRDGKAVEIIGDIEGALAAIGPAALGGVGSGASAAAATALSIGAGKLLGGLEFALRIPAKAWILTGCMPLRYGVSGDFDANDGSISISELEISVEIMEEISLLAT